MENTHATVIAGLSLALQRAARGVGAEVIALLGEAGSPVDILFRAGAQPGASERRFIVRNALPTDALAVTRSTTAVAGSQVAGILREALSEHSKSFLLFPWRGSDRVITGVIGFAQARPPISEAPDAVLENLDLLGWATWSVREIGRLRDELKIVNERLAGRKLVERAKSVLQTERSLSETQAYEYLRGLSRRRRISLAKVSSEILLMCGGR